MNTKPLIAGNWKMNLNHLEAISLVQKVAFSLPEKYFAKVDVTVLPPFTDLRSVQTLVDGDKLLVSYGAQDLSPHEPGAHTGEVAGSMLAKLGCSFVTVGHSERRQYHAEDDALVNKKVAAAIKHELSPILCVGEPLEVREAGEHIEHCTAQLLAGLKGLSAQQVADRLVIAYEPVWAIGTGRVATPADAQEVCAALRSALVDKYGEQASGVRVLYGGSVKSKNIGELVGQTDIDGALVGGASIDAEEFTKLCALAAGGPLP